MTCCAPIEQHFSAEKADGLARDLAAQGPPQETRLLIDALVGKGVTGLSVLDIGSGIGALSEQLLANGAAHALLVDISPAYLNAAQQRLAHLQAADRLQFRQGDVVAIAHDLPDCDIVTLDKVICCYPEYVQLVERSARKARRFYAASYPRDRWATRIAIWFENFTRRLKGSDFRAYVHPVKSIEALLVQQGFKLESSAQTFFWRCVVFEREGVALSGAASAANRPRPSS